AALGHAARLLGANPAMAEAQCREILKVLPGQRDASRLLSAALRGQGRAAEALAIFEPVAKTTLGWAAGQFEWGMALGTLGRGRAAVEALSRAAALDPKLAVDWRALGDHLHLMGDTPGADQAYARHIAAAVSDPALMEAASALCEGRLAVAERLLRGFLKDHPTDVTALRMLAEVGGRLGRYGDAEDLLADCLALAPGFEAARHNYATVLHRQNKPAEALAQVEMLLARDPNNPNYRTLRAAALAQLGEYAEAIDAYEGLLKTHPEHPKTWMSLGHALKTVGRLDEGVAAYRKSLDLLPTLGEAYWSLANLKTFRFAAAELAAMREALAHDDLADEDRFHLDFALGKALEDAGDYAASFEHYGAANARRGKTLRYEADRVRDHAARSIALFTPAFFAERAGWGAAGADPIFIVGLPRAGSTLIEQILASHSQVEGTTELPDIIAMAKRLGGRKRKSDETAYPEILDGLEAADIAALGEEYLQRTRVHRKHGRPFFIDKMPNNFAHVGLIHLILPHARIVDARRGPMAGCFACFKQHFARGQAFTYDLADLGRYYTDYVALMDHFDAAAPGRVHRVVYEEMVADPEREIRRLLGYCGLPFEAACLNFHANDRAVRTPSSEQVRRPIFSEGVDQWRNYEPWLGALKASLRTPATASQGGALRGQNVSIG
ncbi:MAG: sulfotransferase, partial [Caulobacteraceae bacterium]